MGIKIAGVIPARLGSTRLNEKVLKLIHGRPMIEWVWRRASLAKKLSELVVACDDKRILDCVQGFGGKAILTDVHHPNGSSRVAEAASKMQADIFINIQGDEPLIDFQGIDQLAEVFERKPETRVATLAIRKTDEEEFRNPNVVKVVLDTHGRALYFSRSPIPNYREKPAVGISFLKHIGIYGYRREFLLEFVSWGSGTLESIEKLEQLRILERGVAIQVVETAHDSLSVDTAEDLAAVEVQMARLGTKSFGAK